MPNTPELEVIEREVESRFQPTNPITQAIAKKLAKTLYQQRRCEYLINFARSIPTRKLDEMPLGKQTTFKQNVRKLLEKLSELKRSAREYSAALSAQSQSQSHVAGSFPE